jgi:hypothetical protein
VGDQVRQGGYPFTNLQTLKPKLVRYLGPVVACVLFNVLYPDLVSGQAILMQSTVNKECGFTKAQNRGRWSSQRFFQVHSRPGDLRELAIINEIMNGNIPDFLREFAKIKLNGQYRGQAVELTIPVTTDYLAVGKNEDWVRVPMTNMAAQTIASRLGFVLPTRRLVNVMYEQAQVRLRPQPTDWYKQPEQMRFGPNYIVFNDTVNAQLGSRSGLIGGHKKDVVVTNLLDRRPAQVAIYGWHLSPTRPIQTLSAVHSASYEDYSHGIRFVGPIVTIRRLIDGLVIDIPVGEAYQDPDLGKILSDEGPIHDIRAARTCSSDLRRQLGIPQGTVCPEMPRQCL